MAGKSEMAGKSTIPSTEIYVRKGDGGNDGEWTCDDGIPAGMCVLEGNARSPRDGGKTSGAKQPLIGREKEEALCGGKKDDLGGNGGSFHVEEKEGRGVPRDDRCSSEFTGGEKENVIGMSGRKEFCAMGK